MSYAICPLDSPFYRPMLVGVELIFGSEYNSGFHIFDMPIRCFQALFVSCGKREEAY